MAILNKKSRMISFRLSESEYSTVAKCCPAHGVRSVSTFARDATLKAIAPPSFAHSGVFPTPTPGDEILFQLQHQILWLRAELERLAKPTASAPIPQSTTATN